jgi:dTDP-4-amino-4,6-dideoxygalactose transaminase
VISFTKPRQAVNELPNLKRVFDSGTPWGGGYFYKKSSEQLSLLMSDSEVLLTQSCTSALELAALAINIQPGDEVIVPSYGYVTTASAFLARGARVVFGEVLTGNLNVDPNDIQSLITPRTKAIVVVHYGGVACDMEAIMKIAKHSGLIVIEDAAQAIGASHAGRPLGTIGDLGCISFHGTKNLSSGEGGALVLNTSDSEIRSRAHIGHEKGTDRSAFIRGEVDKYTWKGEGSSFIPSEYTCAVLSAQLDELVDITLLRSKYWSRYSSALSNFGEEGKFREIEQNSAGTNWHMYAIELAEPRGRQKVITQLSRRGITATSHYEPLHTSPFALKFIDPNPRELPVTQVQSAAILRLPLWSAPGLDVDRVVEELTTVLRSTS